MFGDFLMNAQGEDVVAGIRTPLEIQELHDVLPETFEELETLLTKLEHHHRDMQDVEFTIEEKNSGSSKLEPENERQKPVSALRWRWKKKDLLPNKKPFHEWMLV